MERLVGDLASTAAGERRKRGGGCVSAGFPSATVDEVGKTRPEETATKGLEGNRKKGSRKLQEMNEGRKLKKRYNSPNPS